MRYWRWIFVVVLLISLVLSACATPSEGTPVTSPEPVEEPIRPTPTVEDSPLPTPGMGESPLPSPVTKSPLPTPSPGEIAFPDVAYELRMKAAAKLDISPDALTALSVEAVTWRDASLGCPEPGKTYAQVLTDGWRAIYQDADGNRIDVHATQDLDRFVICDRAVEEPAERPVTQKDRPAVQAAVIWLARELEVDAEAITVQAVEAVDWPNSCLGCGGMEESCLTVITPGYRVMLEHEGDVYEMRTDRVGRSVRLCERGGA